MLSVKNVETIVQQVMVYPTSFITADKWNAYRLQL